nr:restriction endonuclease subunit S [uncultured Allomuricauda sp.]
MEDEIKGWEIKRVKDVLSVNSCTLSSNTTHNKIFNYISIDCVEQEKIDFSKIIKAEFKYLPSRARRKLKNGDLLFSTVRPNLKSFSIFKKPNNEDWIASTGFAVANAIGNNNSIFFFYQLLSLIGEKQFHSLVVGSNYPAINETDFKKLKVFVPQNPAEQTAIATFLSKVDEAIEATQNSIKAAEKLKKALMQNLLTGKLKPDGSWRTKDEFQETKIGMLPKTWAVKTVKEISTQVTDGEHTTPERVEKGYFLLSARNIKNGYLDLSNVDYVKEKELERIQKRCNPKFGDILISCSGTIGNVCMVPEGLNAGMVRSVALVKLKKDEIEPEFAELVFQSFSLQNQMKVSVSSSVQGNIFQGAIKKLKLPYPVSKEERDMITDKIQVYLGIIVKKQTKIQTLQRLKKSLMQHLFTGKVRLPQEFIAQFEEVEETFKS